MKEEINHKGHKSPPSFILPRIAGEERGGGVFFVVRSILR